MHWNEYFLLVFENQVIQLLYFEDSGPILSLETSNCVKKAEEYSRNFIVMILFFEKALATGSKVLSLVCNVLPKLMQRSTRNQTRWQRNRVPMYGPLQKTLKETQIWPSFRRPRSHSEASRPTTAPDEIKQIN